MKSPSSKMIRANRRIPERCLPAIVAVGSSLVAAPAAALSLGELTVHSRLGQPLRASIAYALAPTEQISDYCVAMRPGPSVSGLPGIGTATVSVASGVIMLTGSTPVREPMVSAHVVINCPYSANLSREYLLLIDPLTSADESAYQQTAITQQVDPQAEPIAVAPTAVQQPVAAVKPKPVVKDIGAATDYHVQSGETLSEIAARIQNRPVGLWPAVNAIFEANPDAFMNNDPNRLKAGSWLSIPSFGGSALVVADAAPTDEVLEPANAIAEADGAAPVVETVAVAESDSAYEPAAGTPASPVTEIVLDDLADSEVTAGNLQPGDIILDAELEGPTTTSSSPNVPSAIITTNRSSNDAAGSSSWLFWLAGSGIAVILGLLMFGRRLRGQSGTSPAAPLADQPPRRRFSDTLTTDTENVEALGVDHDISDDSPTEENLLLDADLIIGTGLTQSSDSDISEDFGFAATTELDLELPFEPVARVSEETDMLPPLKRDVTSILDSEVLPEDEDDDYDMSVIVDATKMPQPEDVTERDLRAVEVAIDDTEVTENYTINKEVDFHVLEQDYEDELTATQALNQEIARAAAELTEHLEEDTADSLDDETTALPLATVTELDVTAQMPAQNDEISDLDDTGINEAVTVNIKGDDQTVEMPVEKGKAG